MHGEQEVAAVQGVHPTGAQDQVLATDGLDRLFAGKLAATVGAQRIGCVGFAVRLGFVAVVDVIGGVVEQRNSKGGGLFGEHAGSRGIDREGGLGLALRLIDRCIGGGIDQQVGSQGADLLADQRGIREVEPVTAEGYDLGTTSQIQLELPRDLAATAGEEDLHSNSSASLKLTPAWSLADSCGAAASGQPMARSGSSQRMQRSCSGA
ncbi:hypothetical protein D3C72_1488740 [compost metagenome]